MIAAAMLLMLVACGSSEQKAAKAAARYDHYYAQRDYYSARIEIKRALSQQDDEPTYWARLARVELASGNYLEAHNAYTRVIELAPKDDEANQALAELAYSGGSFKEAESIADQVLEKQPRLLRMLLVKGSVAASLREIDRARVIAHQILAIDPANEGGKLLLARVVNFGGDRPGAIRVMREAISSDGETIAKLMALLDLYTSNEDFPGAAATFARLFALMPEDVDLRIEYARLLYQRGQATSANGIVARLIRRHPDDVNIHQRVVDLWNEVGSDRVDVEDLKPFVEATGDPGMRIALAHLMLGERRFAEAEAMLRPYVDRDKITAENVEADVLYAGAIAGLGRGGEAMALIGKVLKFDESNPRALLMRVRVSMAAGDLRRALRDAQLLSRDNPQLAEGRIELAEIYVRRREPVLADNAYATAMKDLSTDPAMLRAYLDYLRRTRRAGVALDMAKRFVRESPASTDGWRELSELCLEMRDTMCVDETFRAFEYIPGGMKVRAALAARRAGLPDPPKNVIRQPIWSGQLPTRCERTKTC